MDQFWMVIRLPLDRDIPIRKQPATRYRHATEASARTEAYRLAQAEGVPFGILTLTEVIAAPEPAVIFRPSTIVPDLEADLP